MMTMNLSMRQHGEPAVLTLADYEDLWAVPLSILEQHRVVRVKLTATHALVHPNQYSGTARCAAGQVRIIPRFPDLLLQLRRLFPRQQRSVPLDGYDPNAMQSLGSDLIAVFLQRLEAVIDVGFPFQYSRRTFRSSELTGSLDVGRTIRELDSVGVHHMVIVRRAFKRADPLLADVVHATIDAVESEELLAVSEAIRLDTVMAALPPSSASLTRTQIVETARDLQLQYSDRPDVVDLCIVVRELISEVTSCEDLEYASGVVSFTFTDSDALWERAVQACLAEAGASGAFGAVLHPLRGSTASLYPDGGPIIDPDVVVYSSGRPVLVADAKDYTTSHPDAPGVYQVDSYGRNLGTRHAALFYLSDGEEWAESFGDDAVRISAFGIPSDGLRTLLRLRMACAAAIAAASLDTELG